ncbi:hypothetical protein W02_17510 [Nitrospira sp. KM1]|uniref:TolB family protein n=1 Tax=Nitrospira sp. KM1 TaxID=1936990 RepID=UPI0013A7ACB1|nr:PD40 domain-containing protein [Nitrospira sp. KM1]BCA54611.1 hypothetical protein W02_17510 [Nitrospira sp. KM1]
MLFRRNSIFTVLLAIVYIVQAACSSGGDDSSAPSGPSGPAPAGPVAPTVTSSVNQGGVNEPLNLQLNASGTGPFTWELTTAQTSLPAGVTLQSSGLLSGTPTQEGQFPFSVKVTGQGGSTTKDLKLTTLGSTFRASVVNATTTPGPVAEANGASGADARSFDPGISADGRYVVFDSAASNLTPGLNPGGKLQVYLYDRLTGLVEMVSVSSTGTPGNENSIVATVSQDGNVVVFDSFANNLVAGDTNGSRDVFVRNRAANTTVRISQLASGEAPCPNPNPDCNSFDPSISDDGSVIAFGSLRQLAASDTDDEADVYLYTGSTTLTRLTPGVGGPPAGLAGSPSVSGNGRFVAFASAKENLIAGDTADGVSDIFVYTVGTGALRKISSAPGGTAANGNNFGPSISGDGRFIAFSSEASNLVSGDSNGFSDIFVVDTNASTPAPKLIVNLALNQGDGDSIFPSISRDGKLLAFDTTATNYDAASPDTNGVRDIYIVDRSCSVDFGTPPSGSCTFKRASIGSNNALGNNQSIFPALSGDGTYVAYFSDATNLIPDVGDTNGLRDAFVTKRQ